MNVIENTTIYPNALNPMSVIDNAAIHDSDDRKADEDKLDEFCPVHDTYSMMFVSPSLSNAFFYAMTIFFIQIFILILFIVNLLSESTPENVFVVPVQTPKEVKVGQFIALIVTMLTADDVTRSLDVFTVIYDHDVQKDFPHATKFKWIITRILRLLEGLLVVGVAFIFIIQSDKNLDLFLNFAAVTFVSELDNIAFLTADLGYSLVDLRGLTNKIKHKLKFKGQIKASKNANRVKNAAIVALALTFVSCWAVLSTKQSLAFYYDAVCQKFAIQFGDESFDFFTEVCPDENSTCPQKWKDRGGLLIYSSFSDVYNVKRNEKKRIVLENERPVYYQREENAFELENQNSTKLRPSGKFSYCEDEEAWVFTIEEVYKGRYDEDKQSGCQWLLKSPQTKEYEFDKVPKDGWTIWSGTVDVASDLQIVCIECEDKNNVDADDGFSYNVGCNYRGSCTNQKCMCHDGWLGELCGIELSCRQYNISTPSVPNGLSNLVLNLGEKEEDHKTVAVMIYNHPVYVQRFDETSEHMYVLLYEGARYIVWDVFTIPMVKEHENPPEILKDIFAKFHSTWTFNQKIHSQFRSDFTDVEAPFGLIWTDERTKNQTGKLLDIECIE